MVLTGIMLLNKPDDDVEVTKHMTRFLFSLVFGLVVGVVVGLYIGWVQAPVEYVDSPATDLGPRYKDEYTVMIANGYQVDNDVEGAIQRLRVLGFDNIPARVQEMTERYITSSRDVDDIQALVALSEGLGRLTPIMQPYREVSVPEQTSQ